MEGRVETDMLEAVYMRPARSAANVVGRRFAWFFP